MKLKRFNEEYEGYDDENMNLSPEEKEIKKYKDCINDIEYILTHIKKQPYDYGEAADEALSEIKNLINEVKRK